MAKIRDEDWKKLRLAFKQRSVVLVLGPWLSTVTEGGKEVLLNEAFRRHLASKLHNRVAPGAGAASDENEQVAPAVADLATVAGLLVEQGGLPTLQVEVEEFFRRDFKPNQAQLDLAELPFPIIINATRDKQICKALEKRNIAYREELYNFKSQRNFKYDPSDSRPFVYHLFGAVSIRKTDTREEEETLNSMVLTGSDQVEFVKQIVQTERKIPPTLLAELNATKTFLFVGFNFEDWYLRLLLFGLGLTDSPDAVPAWALHTGEQDLHFSTAVFFRSRYKLNFLQLSTADFIADLKKRYSEEKQQGEAKPEKKDQNVRIFILNDTEDEPVRAEFVKALAVLKIRYDIQIHEVLGGDNVAGTMEAQANDAHFAFPIITKNFFGNEWLCDFYQEKMIPLHDANKTVVSPLLAGPCMWKAIVGPGIINTVLPANRQPVTAWEDVAQAWTDIVQEIEQRIKTHFSA